MILNHKILIGLPVETEVGKKLGKINDFEFDTTSQNILRYHIKNINPIKGMFANELIIKNSQVVHITNEKMIVDDLIIAEKKIEKIGGAVIA